MLEVRDLGLGGAAEIVPRRFGDERGWFSEVWNRERLREAGEAHGLRLDHDWCQDNQSLSAEIGTLRGLHYQAPPTAQAKLVRVLAGAIRDVAVDARAGSPTFGRHATVDLSAERGNQILVPRGFLHGFLTLTPDAVVHYKVDAPYSKADDGAVAWDDPDLAIDWGLGRDGLPERPVLSGKDAAAPRLAEARPPFAYDGDPA